MKRYRNACFSALVLLGCSEEVGTPTDDGAGGSGAGSNVGGAGGTISIGDEGTPLRVEVAPGSRSYVDLDAPTVLGEAAADGVEWDLAFEAYDVFTNSGPSGIGEGGGFGPLALTVFLDDGLPEVPFLVEDRAGGAFLDWYDYEGDTHALWSRYHTYGVKRAEQYWKVQILSYYSEIQGAPISAAYQVRYAFVDETGAAATQELEGIDGTAGGLSGSSDDPSGCIALSSGEVALLTPKDAASSETWDLCFRRDAITVNGGDGGPAGIEAVDLDVANTASESLEDVKARTAASELSGFEDVDYDALVAPNGSYRGDGVVSAFTGLWTTGSPPRPEPATWLVRGADGQMFMVVFIDFEAPSSDGPAAINLRIKKITESN